jgi:hypothetical protein
MKARQGERINCICGNEGVTFLRDVETDKPIYTDDFSVVGKVDNDHQYVCTQCGEWLASPLAATHSPNHTWKIRISKDRWIQ